MNLGRLELKRERAKKSPMRTAILDLLRNRDTSGTDLLSLLPNQPSLAHVSYHLGVLSKAQMVEHRGDGTYGVIVSV